MQDDNLNTHQRRRWQRAGSALQPGCEKLA
jgi:hypothetical protein